MPDPAGTIDDMVIKRNTVTQLKHSVKLMIDTCMMSMNSHVGKSTKILSESLWFKLPPLGTLTIPIKVI